MPVLEAMACGLPGRRDGGRPDRRVLPGRRLLADRRPSAASLARRPRRQPRDDRDARGCSSPTATRSCALLRDARRQIRASGAVAARVRRIAAEALLVGRDRRRATPTASRALAAGAPRDARPRSSRSRCRGAPRARPARDARLARPRPARRPAARLGGRVPRRRRRRALPARRPRRRRRRRALGGARPRAPPSEAGIDLAACADISVLDHALHGRDAERVHRARARLRRAARRLRGTPAHGAAARRAHRRAERGLAHRLGRRAAQASGTAPVEPRWPRPDTETDTWHSGSFAPRVRMRSSARSGSGTAAATRRRSPRSSAPGADANVDELAQLVELALAHDLEHASRIGEALVSWERRGRRLPAAQERLRAAARRPEAARRRRLDALGGRARRARRCRGSRRQPHEPVLLNYVGVALYGLNEPALAVRLFEAVQRLDPTTENVRGNLEAARRRLRKPVRLPLRSPLAIALRALRPSLERARRRAARTQPDAGQHLALHDRRATRRRCSRPASSRVARPSSRDDRRRHRLERPHGRDRRVVRRARRCTSPWTGSFAEARNVGLDAATGDWILWLDADEQLEPGDAGGSPSSPRQPWREAHWLVETNYTGPAGGRAPHRSTSPCGSGGTGPPTASRGAIHEQIRNSMPYDLHASASALRRCGSATTATSRRASTSATSTSATSSCCRASSRRNPRAAFTHFNIGTEYVGMDDLASRAGGTTSRASTLLRDEHAWWELGYAPILVSRLCGVRRMTGDLEGARRSPTSCSATSRPSPTSSSSAALARAGPRRPRRARARSSSAASRWATRRPASPAWSAAARSWRSARSRSSRRNRGRTRRGRALVRALARAAPRVPRRRASTSRALLLAQPDADPDAVLERLEAFPHDELTWYLFLGTAFYERGHAEHAERLLRRCLAIGDGPRRRARRPARGARDPAPLRRGRGGGRRARRGHAAVRRGAAPAHARGDPARRPRRPPSAALAALAAGGGDAARSRCCAPSIAAVLDGARRRALARRSAQRALELLHALARLDEYDAFERVDAGRRAGVGDRREATRPDRRALPGCAASTSSRAMRRCGRSSSAARTRARSRCSARAPSPRACSRTPCPCSRRRSRSTRARRASRGCSSRCASAVAA